MVTVKAELVQGELNVDVDLDLDGATGVLFEKVIEPAADKKFKGNPLLASIDATVMPMIKKEAMDFMAELEDKIEDKIDEKLGQDESAEE